ncbi:MAG: energy transducer TonB [Candidatus Magnetomorum sp.]|nr:energy transducer TonB [Candidatus Magnetomorum sp.]
MILSIGIHAVILFPINDLFNATSMTYIELTLKEESKPYYRSIPRPRKRHKIPEINHTQARHISHRTVNQRHVDPVEKYLANTLMDPMEIPSVPQTPDFTSPQLTNWQPVTETGGFITKRDYIDMLRLSIERHKEYPRSAKFRNIEGRVKVGFEIKKGGRVENVQIVSSSGTTLLDQAAINAIKKASPFPVPPVTVFELPLKLAIIIVFELT